MVKRTSKQWTEEELRTLKADFFDKWTNEMAYVLGAMVSDGNVSKERYRMTFSQSDYPFLCMIASYLGLPEDIIYHSEEEGSYKLQFTNKHMADRLAELGVNPNKSLTQGKVHVPKKFFSHFLRGVHDGDGCFSHSKDGYSPHIEFTCGSYNFLRWLQAKIHKYYGFPMGRIRRPENTWKLRYRKVPSLVLLAIMYRDKKDLYLDRKHDKYAAYVNSHTIRLKEFISSINARLPRSEVEEIVRSINIETKQVDWWKPVAGGYSNVTSAVEGIPDPVNYQGT